jgi:hypothetical protein
MTACEDKQVMQMKCQSFLVCQPPLQLIQMGQRQHLLKQQGMKNLE